MTAAEIRSRFLEFFARQGHAARPSSSLVPADDPTLLFTNAGMVQFKRIFLGLEESPFGRRATTAQKCVRAGGKHNDLEQVGFTARHHTFFEMLGNFSFGDYFKRDAIRFAWSFVTEELGIPRDHLRVSVFRTDDEARALWREIAGLPDSRIYGLGESDNFWQMAETGPCGPCSEIYVDLAKLARDWAFAEGASGEWTDLERETFSEAAFVEGAEAGRFLEIWNLVFMQYDRQADGSLVPLPRPSVDTGAGLERISAVLQGVTNNYHTDLFTPLLARIEQLVGRRYVGRDSASAASSDDAVSFRVLADHARAVAFLLADGVFPSNDGRGYVLRRILRRGVRHAWLLGRREPTLAGIVDEVVRVMGEQYPELRERARHIAETTRAEEERFLATIDAGMRRFDELAPVASAHAGPVVRGTIGGEEAFRLYDTFGFPLDLTELMARERGYTVEVDGFERALAGQRAQSQEDRRSKRLVVGADVLADEAAWDRTSVDTVPRFVGYECTEVDTEVIGVRRLEAGRAALMLRETPFYGASGGQVSDVGEVVGDRWRLEVEEVRKVDGRPVVLGRSAGEPTLGPARAVVPADVRRDTERNHTATHLLHAALRTVLGEHVHQAGSLVEPERLRFDFSHHGPLSSDEIARVSGLVNAEILDAIPVRTAEQSYEEARASGAMALFSEKYGDRVRVVTIPGFSMELCGGTHVRNTSEIGSFWIVAETGAAAGVRRIEAVTGRHAYDVARGRAAILSELSDTLRVPEEGIARRVRVLVEERRGLERRLEEALRGGHQSEVQRLVAEARDVSGVPVIAARVDAPDVRMLEALGDELRERLPRGVAAVGAVLDGKATLLLVVGDVLRGMGVRADLLVREAAAAAHGKGGGQPHRARAGIPDPGALDTALAAVAPAVGTAMARNS